MDYFDKVNELFGHFSNSVELTGLLGTDPSDIGTCDTKIRRSFADATVITPEELPFVDYGFIDSHGQTGNFLVNREVIEFNIYSSNFYEASLIFKAIKAILRSEYEDAQCISSGQRPTALPGVYCFSFRIKAMVSS